MNILKVNILSLRIVRIMLAIIAVYQFNSNIFETNILLQIYFEYFRRRKINMHPTQKSWTRRLFIFVKCLIKFYNIAIRR